MESLFNPKEGGGGSYVPMAQEIACHFSQDHARVLKLPDFFKNDVKPRVKGPVYLLVRWPLIDLLLDLLVKGLRDLLPESIYSSPSIS